MFRCTIVGYDGSPAAEDALALAQQLRDPDGGRLVVATVLAPVWAMAVPGVPVPDPSVLDRDAEAILAHAAERVSNEVPCTYVHVDDPSAGHALDELAAAHGADLIVLGSTHRHAFARLTGRTTVQRMLHGAPCAVVVAAHGHAARLERDGARIAVAYDGSPEAAAALDTAYGLAATTGAGVEVLRVVEPPAYLRSYAAAGMEDDVLDVLHDGGSSDVREALDQAPAGVVATGRVLLGPVVPSLTAAAADADLLVAGSRCYGALHRVLVGSVSTGLLTDGHVPVLVVPRAAVRPTVAA